jgi:N,N-dimethylformamidase
MSTDFSHEPITRPGTLEGHVEPPGAKAPLERHLPGVLAYVDGYSFGQGDEVAVKVSSSEPALRAEIVRLRAPLVHRDPGDSWETYADLGLVDGLTQQPLCFGSHLTVEPHDGLDPADGAVFAGWIRPTLADLAGVQTIFALTDGTGRPLLRLDLLEGGTLEYRMEGASAGSVARLESAVESHRWHRIVAAWSPGRGQLELHCSGDSAAGPHHVTVLAAALEHRGAAGILLGAAPDPEGPWTRDHFNGKLARLRWHSELDTEAVRRLADGLDADPEALLAAWDLAAQCESTQVVDRGPLQLRTTTVNCPQRGVTGPSWSGTPETSFRDSGHDYDAIALHDDDVGDVGWSTTLTWRVPDDAPSCVLAVRLSSATSERFVPFVVKPSGKPDHEDTLLVVLPWYTYIVYANDQMCRRGHENRETAYASDPVRRYLREHPSLGYSGYDRHRDGTGIAYSSARRPILNLSPDYCDEDLGAARHFPADLYLLEFLERSGRRYDVVTDAEVDRLGLDALSPYRCVVTGSHPEYPTARMLDAFDAYVEGGGNIMYLGGNGLYYPVSVSPDRMVIERRYGDSPYLWQSGPGEFHHSFDGQLGADWAALGRSPQRLLGVTTIGEGTGGGGRGYRRMDDLPPEASFVFAGVTSEIVGDHGAAGGGAAGDEIDALVEEDPAPERAVLLARADGFGPYYVGMRPPLRADMVLVLKPGGGRVFSVGSISWTASLVDDGLDNDVARVTANVIDEFVAPSINRDRR